MGTAEKNTGISYELLVRGIFQAIHDQDQVSTVSVEHNKTLQGKTVTHQIDVYWKFEKAGITHEVIVQAKDWENAVNQGQLLQFKGVLDDLPSQPRGIFVTRTGYQQGAKTFAAEHGIILYELGEPEKRPNIQLSELGWIIYKVEFRTFKVPGPTPEEELVDELSMGLNSTVYQPVHSDFVFQIDSPWVDANIPGLDKSNIKLNSLPKAQVILYGPNRTPTCNLDDVVREELKVLKSEGSNKKHAVHNFAGDTFIAPPLTEDSFLKVLAVGFDLEIRVTEFPAQFNLSRFVKIVLREIPSEKTRTFLAPKPA